MINMASLALAASCQRQSWGVNESVAEALDFARTLRNSLWIETGKAFTTIQAVMGNSRILGLGLTVLD